MDQSVGFFSERERERESRREDIESRLASVLYERVTASLTMEGHFISNLT